MLKEDLLKIINDPSRVTVNDTVRENHSKGITYHDPVLPDIVVFPKTEEEVQKVVQYASDKQIPIVPFGVGSSLEGHIIPLKGGITLDFTLMNQITEIRPEDFIVKVQPGVTRTKLNLALKKHGMFFPIDPGADATIGGMAATNASGTNAVYYGTMKHNVLGLRSVMANGSVISTGSETVKTSTGYNLTELLVGSEGTLGVFTEITLKIYGIPEHVIAAKAVFDNVEQAGEAAALVLQSGINIGRIELVDALTIEAVNSYVGTDYEAKPTLFLEFHGNRSATEDDYMMTKELMEDSGALSFKAEADSLKRAQLWEARHQAATAIMSRQPGKLLVVTDVCVPISKLAECIHQTRVLAKKYQIDAAILGHVGDGNFHAAFGVDPKDGDEMARFQEMNREIVELAFKYGGTCSGEHGIGIGKREYLKEQYKEALPFMKMIKESFDPNNIFNPGKIF